MSKRIFTKRFSGQVEVGMPNMDFPAMDSWLLQENIEVIGASIAVIPWQPSENDGYTYLSVELSQTGVFGLDGTILQCGAMEGWNTSPAGISVHVGNVAVSFPNGAAVPVREEGYLFVNAKGYFKTAGITNYNYGVTVYYTKGRSK
ncbi:hypothetical protein ES705_47973 [subsurface metagenome]